MNEEQLQEKIEEAIEEIADCFGGDNIHYHAGMIREILRDLIQDCKNL